jgi:phosphoribosylaminoimidazolecarboxamide formyltransferase/IMP cyclohydrolase
LVDEQVTRIRTALISVYKKDGIVELAERLNQLGVSIITSGGTQKTLEDAGLKLKSVSQITGFPEMLDGRVKTLHPIIFGGILHTDAPEHLDQLTRHGIEPIDLVIVNLYPFEETIAQKDCTFADAIEKIDIGGPSLIRAAAKNFRFKTVIVDPEQYPELEAELDRHDGGISEPFRFRCAIRAFEHTARYNTVISGYLQEQDNAGPGLGTEFILAGKKVQDLRYGENPHQKAAFYVSSRKHALNNYRQLHGKELSYNNILDLDAALCMVREHMDEPVTVIVKHNNPCGAAQDPDSITSYKKALATDPVSAFGGIVGLNRIIDEKLALEMKEHFFECILAPEFSPEAIRILTQKKNLRLVTCDMAEGADRFQVRTVSGGFLVQSYDDLLIDIRSSKVATKRKPTDSEWRTLAFAWRLAKHVHSNAIVFARADQLVGIGAGQMSRVDAAELAIAKASKTNNVLTGSVVASDAFFPFRDGIDVIAGAGATAIIQPGGSVRDEEVISAADEHDIAMIFSGYRHFKH